MSRTAPVKTCTFEKCCIFQEEKNEDLKLPPIRFSPEYDQYTMIETNLLYFSYMPSGSFVLDHTRLDKGGAVAEALKGNKALLPGGCTK